MAAYLHEVVVVVVEIEAGIEKCLKWDGGKSSGVLEAKNKVQIRDDERVGKRSGFISHLFVSEVRCCKCSDS